MQRLSARKGGLVLRQEQTVATADRAPATEVVTVIIIHLQWNYHPSWSDSVYKKLHPPPPLLSEQCFAVLCWMRCRTPAAFQLLHVAGWKVSLLSSNSRCFLKWSFWGYLTCGRRLDCVHLDRNHPLWVEWRTGDPNYQCIYMLLPLFILGLMLFRLSFALSFHYKQTSNHLNNI